MKRLLLIVLAALTLMSPVFAQKKKSEQKKSEEEAYKVVLTLNDGSTVEGYIRSTLNDEAEKVRISDSPNGAFTTYKSSDVKTLVYPATEEDPEEVVWEPVRVVRKYARKAVISDEPKFLRLAYKGNSLDGYVCKITDVTTGGFQGSVQYYSLIVRYYFRIHGQDFATGFEFRKGINVGVKKAFANMFSDYPEFAEKISSGEIKIKDIQENPAMLVVEFDKFLSEN